MMKNRTLDNTYLFNKSVNAALEKQINLYFQLGSNKQTTADANRFLNSVNVTHY